MVVDDCCFSRRAHVCKPRKKNLVFLANRYPLCNVSLLLFLLFQHSIFIQRLLSLSTPYYFCSTNTIVHIHVCNMLSFYLISYLNIFGLCLLVLPVFIQLFVSLLYAAIASKFPKTLNFLQVSQTRFKDYIQISPCWQAI